MANTRVNHREIERKLKGEWADKACRPEAEKALARQQATAPVDTGALKDSLRIREVQHPTRKVFQVGSDLPYALPVEANTGFMARSL
jgi:hypothetical protein